MLERRSHHPTRVTRLSSRFACSIIHPSSKTVIVLNLSILKDGRAIRDVSARTVLDLENQA